MASMLDDGSVLTANGKVILPDDPISPEDLCEVIELLCPPPEQTSFGGGGGGGGSTGFAGVAGPQGAIGAQGPAGGGEVIEGGLGFFAFSSDTVLSGQAVNRFILNSQDVPGNTGVWEMPATQAGTLRRFVVSVLTNTLDGDAIVSVTINGVPSALAVTYTAGETGIKLIDIPVAVAVDDLIVFNVNTLDATFGPVSDFEASGNVEFLV